MIFLAGQPKSQMKNTLKKACVGMQVYMQRGLRSENQIIKWKNLKQMSYYILNGMGYLAHVQHTEITVCCELRIH